VFSRVSAQEGMRRPNGAGNRVPIRQSLYGGVPIQSSQKFGGGSGNIYFWFQTRDCATGPLKILCSPWRWHGARYTIKQGGWFLADADV